MSLKFSFSAKIWQVSGKGGWFFVSLPSEMSNEIRTNFKKFEEGWGRLKVLIEIKNNKWETAIWYDTKLSTYLLPIKSEIRMKHNLVIDEIIQVIIYL